MLALLSTWSRDHSRPLHLSLPPPTPPTLVDPSDCRVKLWTYVPGLTPCLPRRVLAIKGRATSLPWLSPSARWPSSPLVLSLSSLIFHPPCPSSAFLPSCSFFRHQSVCACSFFFRFPFRLFQIAFFCARLQFLNCLVLQVLHADLTPPSVTYCDVCFSVECY